MKILMTVLLLIFSFCLSAQGTFKPIKEEIIDLVEFDERTLRVCQKRELGNIETGVVNEAGTFFKFKDNQVFGASYQNSILSYIIDNQVGRTNLTLYQFTGESLVEINSQLIDDYVDGFIMNEAHIVCSNNWEGSGNSIYILNHSLTILDHFKPKIDETIFSSVSCYFSKNTLNIVGQYGEEIQIVIYNPHTQSVVKNFKIVHEENVYSIEQSGNSVYLKSLKSVTCLDLNGTTKWSQNFDSPLQNLVISEDDQKAVIFHKDDLCVINAKTGVIEWRKKYSELFSAEQVNIRPAQVHFKKNGEVNITLGNLTLIEDTGNRKKYVLRNSKTISSKSEKIVRSIEGDIPIMNRAIPVNKKHLVTTDEILTNDSL